MAITAIINNVTVNVKPGIVIRDHYNEILDGGTIVIPQTAKLNIRPFDQVVLSGSPLAGPKTYLVAHYSERQIAFTPTAIFEYSVSLVSKTIKLQRTFLPNVSITQPVTGAGITIATAIQRYANMYGEQIITFSGGTATLSPKYTFSSTITGLTNLVPEFTLSRPTLFELFNTMLARENKIIRLKGNDELDVFDLTQKYDPIDVEQLSYIEQTENSGEYLSETEIEFFNVLTDDANSDAGYDTPIETTIRADASILNTENASLLLSKPIYKILSIKYVHFTTEDMGAIPNNSAYKEFDITPYIVERTDYELLTTNPFNAGTKKYQRIYYTQGGNKIEGLMYRPFSIIPEAIFGIASLATGGDGSTGGLSIASNYGIGNWLFRIKYIPQNDAKMRTSKYIGEPYPAITIDGQKANFGNLDLIADEQFKNSQRIGQAEKTITASRYTLESQVPKLGDFMGDYIVTSREISFNEGFIIFKGTLAKDYVNKTMFTGVTSKRRLYEIASGGESVSRHDLIKLFYEFTFSTVPQLAPRPTFTLRTDFALAVLRGATASADDIKPIAAIIRTLNNGTPIHTYAILKETIEQAAKNSVIWSFEMQDNFSAGLKQDGAVTGGTALRYVSYVDSLGTYDSINIKFISKTQAQTKYTFPASGNQVLVTWANGSTFMDYAPQTNLQTFIDKFKDLPEIPTSDIPATNILEVQKTLHKDNREITKISVQHEFVSDTLDIIVGDEFVKTSRLFKATGTTRRVYFSTTHKYNIYENKTAVGSFTDNLTFISYTNSRITINTSSFTTITGVAYSTIASWAIATTDGKLILGVNKGAGATTASIISLNILENRHL